MAFPSASRTSSIPPACRPRNGTLADAGRRPRDDATVIRRLKRAGATILGKTVTTELAYFHPGKTRNPHNPGHTPGGSSSGSAAAVAAGVVPLALGTQTNGSVIRPASFCGVVGFKPSFGAFPRTGVMEAAASLDTIGVFARSVADAALAAEALIGADGADPAAIDQPAAGLLATATAEPPVRPAIAFVRTPAWDRAEPATHAAFEELCAAIGDVDDVPLPEIFDGVFDWHKAIMAAEMAASLGRYVDKTPESMSDAFNALVADGRAVAATDYLAARNWQAVLASGLDAVFDRYDAILTPAAPGEAPKGLGATGDPSFNTLWTFCGTPAITLPLMTGEARSAPGCPIGRAEGRRCQTSTDRKLARAAFGERCRRRQGVNTGTENIVAIAALIGFVIFVGVLVWFVREVDLIIVVLIGVTLASYDFFKTLIKPDSAED